MSADMLRTTFRGEPATTTEPAPSAAQIRSPHVGRLPAFRAHPLLDPDLRRHEPGLARLWLRAYRTLMREPPTADDRPGRASIPGDGVQTSCRPPSAYFRDVENYLNDVLQLVPGPAREALRPLASTRALSDVRSLLHECVTGTDPRARYEAQRKLYLARLLFDIDHCRPVRDGRRHKHSLATLLNDALFGGESPARETVVCCRYVEDEARGGALDVGVAPDGDARCWRFRVLRLTGTENAAGVEVFHHRYRFKGESLPAAPVGRDDGSVELTETDRWPSLGRRSGSILSKMITRGIADPKLVQDILGAMFIVGDRRQCYVLEQRILHLLGGPVRVRDRVDTLANDRQHDKLTHRSAPGFRVLKETVDVLSADPGGATPYLFGVEVQIYPLDAYLATLHDRHYANHAAYKRRQFLNDLMPALFPAAVYGSWRDCTSGDQSREEPRNDFEARRTLLL